MRLSTYRREDYRTPRTQREAGSAHVALVRSVMPRSVTEIATGALALAFFIAVLAAIFLVEM